MCCWERKPRYFCVWCRMPLFWHPLPGKLEPCLSSRVTGGRALGNCVEGKVRPVESECIYTGYCADCARIVGRGEVPPHYRDVKPPRRRVVVDDRDRDGENNPGSGGEKRVRSSGRWAGFYGGRKKSVRLPEICVIL